MNIFWRELKSHRNSTIFWAIGMIFLVGSGMAKYGAYQSTGQSMNELLDQFPKTIKVVFGISGFDLSSAGGYFGLLFMYIALMATVHAVLIGSDLIAKEERDHTSEFLFVRPISRIAAITSKLLAGVLLLIIFNLVTCSSSYYFVNYFNRGGSVTSEINLLMTGLFFLQLIFFSIGAAIAGTSKKPKTVAGAATAVLLITFFLSFLVNMSEKLDILKYLTPFKYFDARDLLTNNKLSPGYIMLSGVIIVVAIFFTYRSYTQRDLNI